MVLAMLMAVPAFADEAAQKLLDCMRSNIPPTLRIQEVELTATDRSKGERVLKGRLFAMRENELVRAVLRIAEPVDLKGAAYLLKETEGDHGDDMYMFLPAVNRVRRIAGASADSALLGTDFSYNDIKQLQNAFGGSEVKLEKPETIDQHPVTVALLTPKPGTSSRYSRIRAWVDQKSCVALKVDFYEGDAARKELTAPAASLSKDANYWYVSEATMRDLKEGTQTRLKVVGVTSGAEMPTRLFDPHSFYLGN
jgi:hypothetical protein